MRDRRSSSPDLSSSRRSASTTLAQVILRDLRKINLLQESRPLFPESEIIRIRFNQLVQAGHSIVPNPRLRIAIHRFFAASPGARQTRQTTFLERYSFDHPSLTTSPEGPSGSRINVIAHRYC